jgi:hypothetical protein
MTPTATLSPAETLTLFRDSVGVLSALPAEALVFRMMAESELRRLLSFSPAHTASLTSRSPWPREKFTIDPPRSLDPKGLPKNWGTAPQSCSLDTPPEPPAGMR